MTYHEKVALAMSQTHTVGSLYTYDVLLEKLLEKIPDEDELRKLIARYEDLAYEAGFQPGITFIDEDNKEDDGKEKEAKEETQRS